MKKLPVIILLLISAAAFAQPVPKFLKSAAEIRNDISYDIAYASMGGKLYFCDFKGIFVADGAEGGTRLVKEVLYLERPYKLAALNDKLVFLASDSAHGTELWVSDGTAEGTHLLVDIYPGKANGISLHSATKATYILPVLNNEAYFYGNNGVDGIELWKTDGTAAGTVMVKDMNTNPGAGIRDSVGESHILVYRNRLYFQAKTPNEGLEIWSTDGTATGTQILKDMVPGNDFSWAGFPFVSYNKLFFSAAEPIDQNNAVPHMYAYDGVDIELFTDTVYTGWNLETHSAGGKTFFVGEKKGRRSLYVTDGTRAGTIPLTDAQQSIDMSEAGDRLVFSKQVSGQYVEYELWVSDGTPQGTFSIVTFPATIEGNTTFGNRSYFKTAGPQGSMQLWSTDGTPQGTKQIMYPGADYSEQSFVRLSQLLGSIFMVHGTRLFFFGGFTKADGPSLYTLDMWGSGINTAMAKQDIRVYPNPATDAITIQADDAKLVSIMNITGAIVHHSSVQGYSANTINTTALTPGLYTISVLKNDGTTATTRFVKK